MLPVTRMIVYPATLAYHAGSDLLLSAAPSAWRWKGWSWG